MTKTFTFGNDNFTKTNNTYSFLGNSSSANYSKILDDIILTDIIKKNTFLLKDYSTPTYTTIINDPYETEFSKAVKFLTNYKKYTKKYKLPYIIGKCYTLADGTPIVFYENNIQIGYDFYDYEDFDDLSFLKNLTAAKKKTIIDIYIKGAKNININIL